MHQRVAGVCWAMFLCLMCPAIAIAADRWTWPDSWHADQDLWAPGNEDRNYTMGVRFNWYGQKATDIPFGTLPLLARIDRALGLPYQPNQALPTVSFGGNAFTPDNLRTRVPIFDDRPYASLVYVASSVAVPSDDDRSARASKLIIGMLGLPLAEWLQTGIHKINRATTGSETPYDPEGWDNQISDGGEPTAMYQRSWMRRLGKDPGPMRPRTDAAASCDVSAGFQTGLSCGVAAKWWGRTNDDSADVPFWLMLEELNPQGDAAQLLSTGAKLSTMRAEKRTALDAETALPSAAIDDTRWISEWYVVGGLRARVVGYNELLQGGLRDSAYTVDSSDIERVVWEGSVGLNLTFRNRNRFMFTCTRRSPEHTLSQQHSHWWCGFNYHVKPRLH